MSDVTSPAQIIYFGSPGTGKSHHIKSNVLNDLGIEPDSDNCIATVFHPEYGYGDFMGKLLPHSEKEKVQYKYYPGHFLNALGKAYRNILDSKNDPNSCNSVVLLIEEINRGNSAAIFGTVFQLLDREANGWSTYGIDISDMESDALVVAMGGTHDGISAGRNTYRIKGEQNIHSAKHILGKVGLSDGKIKLPPNLSILATMNTSDSSVYYMDTAFKRRWNWQYVQNNGILAKIEGNAFTNETEWRRFIDKLNAFIRDQSQYIRRVEDKQIGYWFVAPHDIVSYAKVQNKIMFYLWDSVFATNRKSLTDILGVDETSLTTFGDFSLTVKDFVTKIASYK